MDERGLDTPVDGQGVGYQPGRSGGRHRELEVDGFLERMSEREWHEEHVVVQGTETPLDEWDLSESPAWSTTIKGNALAMASAAGPVLRKTAERLLAEFLDRVKEVRESDTYLYRVKRVILFGSMLDQDRSHVNDIDLVVELVHKVKDRETALGRIKTTQRRVSERAEASVHMSTTCSLRGQTH
jgi:predicted nucleotidyltransferase